MVDQDMSKEDKKRSAAALAEARRLTREAEAKWTPDPDEPEGPNLKTGFGLTSG